VLGCSIHVRLVTTEATLDFICSTAFGHVSSLSSVPHEDIILDPIAFRMLAFTCVIGTSVGTETEVSFPIVESQAELRQTSESPTAIACPIEIEYLWNHTIMQNYVFCSSLSPFFFSNSCIKL
jgi:hypothetical protein